MSHAADQPGPTGVLVVDKPLGAMSAAMCTLVKGRLKRAHAGRVKVGHGGTLDPLATGVLIVLVGRATKLSDAVMASGKEYLAEVDLSARSPTDDLEAEPIAVHVARPPTEADVRAACHRFLGPILQTPPEHSAMKVGGKRAYTLARAGVETGLRPRPVEIREIELVSYAWPTARLRIACGKGVYIRSLARDLGLALGVGGVLTALRRTRVGPFTLDEARTPDQLPDPLAERDLLSLDDARMRLRTRADA
ncbi:MAG: tRNA pseudouridine(55) synthase TruB [Phycisphaerales bacterium]